MRRPISLCATPSADVWLAQGVTARAQSRLNGPARRAQNSTGFEYLSFEFRTGFESDPKIAQNRPPLPLYLRNGGYLLYRTHIFPHLHNISSSQSHRAVAFSLVVDRFSTVSSRITHRARNGRKRPLPDLYRRNRRRIPAQRGHIYPR